MRRTIRLIPGGRGQQLGIANRAQTGLWDLTKAIQIFIGAERARLAQAGVVRSASECRSHGATRAGAFYLVELRPTWRQAVPATYPGDCAQLLADHINVFEVYNEER